MQNRYHIKNNVEIKLPVLLQYVHSLQLTNIFNKYYITSVNISFVLDKPSYNILAYLMKIHPIS